MGKEKPRNPRKLSVNPPIDEINNSLTVTMRNAITCSMRKHHQLKLSVRINRLKIFAKT